MRGFLAGLLVCGACSGPATSDASSAASAETVSAPAVADILAAMRARYRTAKSYRDEGTFREVFHARGESDRAVTGRFRTVWQQPSRLAFVLHEDADEFQPPKTLAAWTPRSGGVKQLFLGEIEDESSLDLALGGFAGVSHGVTALVPRWLSEGGCDCRRPYEPRPMQACGDAMCVVLVSKAPGEMDITLFIDPKTSALRRFDEHGTVLPTKHSLSPDLAAQLTPEQRERIENLHVEPFDVDETIEIVPAFDIAIDDKDFEGSL